MKFSLFSITLIFITLLTANCVLKKSNESAKQPLIQSKLTQKRESIQKTDEFKKLVCTSDLDYLIINSDSIVLYRYIDTVTKLSYKKPISELLIYGLDSVNEQKKLHFENSEIKNLKLKAWNHIFLIKVENKLRFILIENKEYLDSEILTKNKQIKRSQE